MTTRTRPIPDPIALAGAVLAGDRLAVARAVTQIENGTEASRPLLAALFPHTGKAHIIGVTGTPGAGKSTLVAALAREFRALGQTVGIVAVDPTSPFTGGALLGDRVRMRALSGDRGIFIRSMATRGSLGGLSRTTGGVVAVLDAAGFDRIIVETVGVGQAEVEIAGTAHTTVVVEAPGLGDEVQAIKAGILEIADILVVNKADRAGADRTARALNLVLEADGGVEHPDRHHVHLFSTPLPIVIPNDHEWQVEILQTAAVSGDGVPDLAARIIAHYDYLQASGGWETRQHLRAVHALESVIHAELERRLAAVLTAEVVMPYIDAIQRRKQSPIEAGDALFATLLLDHS